MGLFAARLQAQSLSNGGFESYPLGWGYGFFDGGSQGWLTTAPDNQIEIWGNGFLGVPADEGNLFAELNASWASTLYQDVGGIGLGDEIGWFFSHRGRDGIDMMNLTITDLGIDNVIGGDQDTVLFTQDFSSGNTAWNHFYGAGIYGTGNTLRFAFSAVSTATGDTTSGNLIDNTGFGIYAVPTPSAFALMGLAGFVFGTRRRRD